MPVRKNRLKTYANRRPVPVSPSVDERLKPAPEPLAHVLVIADSKDDLIHYVVDLGADPDLVREVVPYLRYLRLGLPYQWALLESEGLINTSRKGAYVARDLVDGDTVFRYEGEEEMTPVGTLRLERGQDGYELRAKPTDLAAVGAVFPSWFYFPATEAVHVALPIVSATV